ncbi:MAG: thioredoxin family protein [Verrucomicrobiae bacterium]|nr:thioredoxin family protein [Verrucomicrobiae bacterium]
MKTLIIAGATAALFSISAFTAETRTWTNTEGKTLTGSFEGTVLDSSGQITAAKVRLANGQQFTLQLANLSDADKEYVSAAAQQQTEDEQKAKLASRKAKWTDDWDKAQAEAKESGLPILLFMTGSDWCGYCMKLKENVLDKKTFESFANENLVLMEADFPRASQSRSLKEQNAKLKEQYPATGFPTVFLLKDGEVLGKFVGYGGDSDDDYIAKLKAKIP